MTDTAPATNLPLDVLTPFDGTPVIRSTIQITKAGDGLSEAMKVEPRELHLDDEVYVVIKTHVTRVLFKPMDKDSDYLVRVHTLEAGDATIVDASLVSDVIAAQAEKILRAREEEAGVKRLPFGDVEPDAETLAAEHEMAAHFDGPIEGCPTCEADVAANDDAGRIADADAPVPIVDEGDGDEADEAAVLRRNHMAGNHEDEPMPGCPTCDETAVKRLMGNGS